MSAYPQLEGRFPQVAGVEFGFNPSKPKGQRIDPESVKVQDFPVDLMKVRLVMLSNLQVMTDSLCLPTSFMNIAHEFSIT